MSRTLTDQLDQIETRWRQEESWTRDIPDLLAKLRQLREVILAMMQHDATLAEGGYPTMEGHNAVVERIRHLQATALAPMEELTDG